MTQNLINKYIAEPNSYSINIELANHYENTGQLGSAVSHYLKAADLTSDDKSSYAAVSGTARCFSKAGGRESTVESLLKRAIALSPKTVDPYVELCKHYEIKNQWFDCYMVASIGIEACRYEGIAWLLFFKAVAAWWIGNTQEARELMYCLWVQKDKINDNLMMLVRNNIYSIDEPYAYSRHRKWLNSALKRSIPGIEDVDVTYSQCNQDLFALLVAKGKRNGFYLEIGSGDPEHHNNTCTLERSYGWDGISVDNNFSATQRFRALRKNACLMADATTLDYVQILSGAPKVIDYLQIDVDPPQSLSLDVLYKIPFDIYTFRSITFEHNAYETWPDKIREKSREYLESKGYKLVVSDVAVRENRVFEDWWIHKSVEDFKPQDIDTSDRIKTSKTYFYDMKEFEKLHLTGMSKWVTL